MSTIFIEQSRRYSFIAKTRNSKKIRTEKKKAPQTTTFVKHPYNYYKHKASVSTAMTKKTLEPTEDQQHFLFLRKKEHLMNRIRKSAFITAIETRPEAHCLYKKKAKTLTIIDCFWNGVNIITILTLFFSSSYEGSSTTELDSENIVLIICVILSIIACILMTIRRRLYINIKHLKYLLGLRPKPQQKGKEIMIVIFEYLVHIIQPYPFVTYIFKISITGYKTNLNIDLILWLICSIRIYSIIHTFKNLSNYYSPRAERIYSLFGIKHIYNSIYKIETMKNGFWTILVSFLMVILFGSCLFEAFERILAVRFQEQNLYESFVFVIESCTRIGIGDILPLSIGGRILGIFFCIFGICSFSQIVLNILFEMTLNNENEKKAYQEILLLSTKEKKNDIYNIYFNSLIGYKMKRIQNDLKLVDNLSLLHKNGEVKLLREKYSLRIRAMLKVPITFNDFSKFINVNWGPHIRNIIDEMKEKVDSIQPYNDFFCDNIFSYRNDVFNCVLCCNQLTNLIQMIHWCGPTININNNNKIIKDKVLKHSMFEVKMKEFFMRYQDRAPAIIFPSKTNLKDKDTNEEGSYNHSAYYSDDSDLYSEEYNESMDLYFATSRGDDYNSH